LRQRSGRSDATGLVDEHILGSGQHCFLVIRGDNVVGLMTLQRIKEVPRPEWATTRAGQVMLPLEQLKSIDPDTEVWTALEKLDRDGVNQLPVTREDHVVGMLSREDVISFPAYRSRNWERNRLNNAFCAPHDRACERGCTASAIDEHRNGAVGKHLGCDASEYECRDATATVRGHHDQIAPLLLRGSNDCLMGADHSRRASRHRLLSRPLPPCAPSQILARVASKGLCR
jgi:hypothetical protein